MPKKPIYITTTLPYVNAKPHIGFALEIVQADIFARVKRMSGNEVFFNFGVDEHGLKIYRKAEESNVDPQTYVDEYAAKFNSLKRALNLSYDNFIRTTDEKHKKATQEFWLKCLEAGDIYKDLYSVKYCVGCELEKTESELVDGKCPIHPSGEIETIEEENFFFKWSKYQKPLLDLYKNNKEFVIPEFRLTEIEKFVEGGLKDFSISRLKNKMPWGVSVPNEPNHVMYVWFDALVNYISAVGWPTDSDKFQKWWIESGGVIQFAGKDNLRQQSAMWQAMLMSAGIPTSKTVFVHGFINSGGQKMSKSLGNVIDPIAVIEEFGTDALRYFLVRHIHPFEDSDFTNERMLELYNAHLANGLGNLFSRIMKMVVDNVDFKIDFSVYDSSLFDKVEGYIDRFEFNLAMDLIWQEISKLDLYIQETEPFKKVKTDKEGAVRDMISLAQKLYVVATSLIPFMPETADVIIKTLEKQEMPAPLFLRKK
jgi:methionyl-tRNA synthetase